MPENAANPSSANSADTGDGVLSALRQLGRPEPWLVGPDERRVLVDDLLSGEFKVFGKQTRLTPPVDWSQDPYDNRSWRYDLHTLKWLKPLLLSHAEQEHPRCLSVARELLCDWANTHLESAAEVSEFAWYDMAVGLRAPYFAYVLRASLAADDINVEDAELLLRTAERHGIELADEARYAAGHNHGLFQDEGLYILARQLPVLSEAVTWRSLAVARLRLTLKQTVNFAEGAHLEHSSAYQFSIAGLVARLAQNISEMPELRDLRDRLRETAAWHVTPANRLAQLGDTDDVPAPKWACTAASKLDGLNALFETGQAFVRKGDSYLAVAAGYHSSAHKHSDDGSFILIENGITILGDAGRWGYYEEEADRVYARSAAAHNVLTVDGQDFAWREAEPYGSGLEAAGNGEGWYAIIVSNPLLAHTTKAERRVMHRRVLLYQPGYALIVIDCLEANMTHDFVRYLHFGPGLQVRSMGNTIFLTAHDFAATVVDHGASKVKVHRGQISPRLLGWTYPSDRTRRQICSAALDRRSSGVVLASTLDLKGHGKKVMSLEAKLDRAIAVELDDNSAIEVSTDGQVAHVSLTRD